MDKENYEQLSLSQEFLEGQYEYLLPNTDVQVNFHNDRAIGVQLPASVVLTITDTLEGRVVKTDSESPDGQRWMTLLPGSPRWISDGVAAMCASLPSGQDWLAHRRERQLGA